MASILTRFIVRRAAVDILRVATRTYCRRCQRSTMDFFGSRYLDINDAFGAVSTFNGIEHVLDVKFRLFPG